MSQEREIEFKEIPNTYRIFTDKVTVLERKVLFEKTEESNYFDPFEDFFGGQGDTHDLALNDIIHDRQSTLEQAEQKVLFEKNLFLIRNKKEIKKRRSDILQHMHHVKTSQTSESSIIDITSFEGINFNRPCTNEEKIELRRQFDYYVYPEAIDEINCEIKEKDIDGADSVRLDCGLSYNGVSSDLFRNFTEHQTKRLPEDYENQVKKMLFEAHGIQLLVKECTLIVSNDILDSLERNFTKINDGHGWELSTQTYTPEEIKKGTKIELIKVHIDF